SGRGSSRAAATRSGVPASSTPARCARSPTGCSTTESSGRKVSIDSTNTCISCRKRRKNIMVANAIEKSEDRELRATRVFDAPRELVWKMWTEREHVAQWWGPRGFRNTIEEMDVRRGGHWRFVMHGPDGQDYQNHSVYVEVVKPERIVFDHVSGPLFRATAVFEHLSGKTRLTGRGVVRSAELRNMV